MEKRYYVAYGSNLNVRQMLMRCPDARMIGTATIPNYRLMFKGSKTGSYLTIEPENGMGVPVGVWAVSAADERALDRYEGYPNFYYKKELELPITGIRSGKVRNRKVFVYIMHEDRPLGTPTNFYMRTCMEGYYNFGFDYEYLLQAYEYSKEGVRV
ncbi:MAG: gamma-glutamylcyclotransferase [Oscillospiraceae bacterium]|nr:gamma-glutamylcyclotransferase [Oscillospiraceae bacterium]